MVYNLLSHNWENPKIKIKVKAMTKFCDFNLKTKNVIDFILYF